MSKNLPNMLESTMAKIREMVDANSVVGEAITTGDVTIVPISKISVGFGGGGSDFATKNSSAQEKENFGGGVGAGVKVTPVAFIIIKDGSVRMLPVAAPANTTADRIVEMVPDTLDKITDFIDSHWEKKENK